MSNALSLPGDHGTARIPSILSGPHCMLSASHLTDSGILLTFAERVLIAVPCSVTTTATDDEFSIPTNTPGWHRGSHFPPLAGLGGMHRIFSPNSRMGVLSLRSCSLCSGVFPSMPMSPVHQQTPPTSTISLRRAGFCSQCDARAQLSVFWPDWQRAPLHVPRPCWTGFLQLAVSLERFGFLLDGLVRFPLPTLKSP